MSNKVLRGDTTIWAAHIGAFADPANPTVAEMSDTSMVFDISCAIVDDYTLNQTASATDDTLSVCDTGNVSNPTSKNYEASLDSFADEDPDAASVYNKARDLFRVKNRDFYLIKRLNKQQGSAVTIGDILFIYLVSTDNQQLIAERGAVVRYGNRFKPQGKVYSDREVAA